MLLKLAPVRFRYLAEPDQMYLGFVSEELPESLSLNGRHSISPMTLSAFATSAVQGQGRAVAELNQRDRSTAKRLQALEARLRAAEGVHEHKSHR